MIIDPFFFQLLIGVGLPTVGVSGLGIFLEKFFRL